ncbi:hypothetical protein GW915_14285, partial [bacterium]|nr:hypothetical protein [bacterium]
IPTADISALKSDVSGLKSELGKLNSRLTALESQLATLDARLAVLEEVKEVEEILAEETTRWSTDVWLDYTGYRLVTANLEGKRIEDGGDYTIYLGLWNQNIIRPYTTVTVRPADNATAGLYLFEGTMYKCTGTVCSGASMSDIYGPVVIDEIEISFRPKTGDRVKVDADKTYLDNYRAPFLDWGITVSERSDGTCRSIKAVSGIKFTLPIPEGFIGTPENPYPYEMRLMFELYYK